MATNLTKAVTEGVSALGYELVDVETSGHGLVRVFIDQPAGISVGDCEKVSNHLTRVFAVENIEFDRLEVSSPGLDRPLRTLGDFQRFSGSQVKVRLMAPVEGRKRFDGVVISANATTVEFALIESTSTEKVAETKKGKRKATPPLAADGKRIRVTYAQIEKARLVPDL